MDKVVRFGRSGKGGVLSDRRLFDIAYNGVWDSVDDLRAKGSVAVYDLVSEKHNTTSVDLELVFASSREYGRKIMRLDDPEIVKSALRVIQDQRMIGDHVYRVVRDRRKFMVEGGQQIIAVGDEPLLRMVLEVPEKRRWVANPAKVEAYGGRNFFSHTPHLDTGGSFDLRLHIEDGVNNGLVEEVFRRAFEHYREAGFALLPEEDLAETG
jgi:hypothetical protein